MTDHKIHSLDGLRGIAAITVIFSHITMMFYPYLHFGLSSNPSPSSAAKALFNSPFTFFYKGTSSVMLFFLMSGFVLSYSLIRKGLTNDFLHTAILKRYFRLNIPAATSVIICALLMKFNLFHATDFGITLPLSSAYTEDPGIIEALKQAAYGSLLLGHGSFNYVLWTINIEFFGSILVYFLMVFFGHNKFVLRLACLMVSILTLTSSSPFTWGIGLFSAGVFLATIDSRPHGDARSKLLSLATLICGVYLYGFNSESASYFYVNKLADFASAHGANITKGFIVSIIGSIMIMSCFCINAGIFSVINKKIFRWLGKLSFSVYLTHSIILALIAPYVVKYVGLGVFSVIVCTLIVLPVTIIFSVVFCSAIDAPAIKYCKNLSIKFNDFFRPSVKNESRETHSST